MTQKRQVELEITSTIDGSTTKQQVIGELYDKPPYFYLRYVDIQSDLGHITTVLKWSNDNARTLHLTRQGNASASMVFNQGSWSQGRYDTPYGPFALQIFTNQMILPTEKMHEPLEWSYDMYMNDELSGRFVMRISIA